MAQQPKSLPLIEQLIAFDTVSAKSNLTLIEFVRDYLLENGVECRLVHNAEGTKANLYATIGPPDRPGIMLSGHTDVVPVEGRVRSTPSSGSQHGGSETNVRCETRGRRAHGRS